ncbi:MAG: hypothetical protein ACUVSZ_02265 [Chloroflexus sp.]|uniref:hypothetical protein n=1 Tax=Chloroflexus sp. TaxID=1904827 RepID=UPI00404A3515
MLQVVRYDRMPEPRAAVIAADMEALASPGGLRKLLDVCGLGSRSINDNRSLSP